MPHTSRRNLFILNGHPAENSLSRQMAVAFAKEAEKRGHEVRVVHLRDLEFDTDFGVNTYREHSPLEPDLQTVSDNLIWCSDLILFMPMWWGGMPAKLKGLVDRVLLPDVFFKRGPNGGMPKPLLNGRRAQVFVTSDSPWWYFRFFIHRALRWQMKVQVLGFIGFKLVRFRNYASASRPKKGAVERWIKDVKKAAAQLT